MLNRYGILGTLRLVLSLIFTKVFYSNSRLIRLPFDIRNRKHINMGKNLTTGVGCRFESYPKDRNSITLTFGKNVEINDYVHISAGEKIYIGDNVLIASRVFISDINHGKYSGLDQDTPLSKPNDRKLSTSPIIINENVWIGEGVCILPGVRIGKGCIIGALSVVTKDIPDFSIAVGIPAKIIKFYDSNLNRWVPAN